jgi:uncharacterized protein YjiS (DUF1127 family)
MTTLINFLKSLIHHNKSISHNELCPMPDELLRDIGVSRVFVYLS